MSEKRLLQIAVALAGVVPLTAGALGILAPGMLGIYGDRGGLSHAAYLSGLLLGIGLAYWWLIPDIEKRRGAFTLLTVLVQVGGLARLVVAIRLEALSIGVGLALLMELAVAPLLWFWQRRLSK